MAYLKRLNEISYPTILMIKFYGFQLQLASLFFNLIEQSRITKVWTFLPRNLLCGVFLKRRHFPVRSYFLIEIMWPNYFCRLKRQQRWFITGIVNTERRQISFRVKSKSKSLFVSFCWNYNNCCEIFREYDLCGVEIHFVPFLVSIFQVM